MTMQIPEALPRETAHDYALRAIKENIICLELAPGSPVSENELSEALKVSRTPVRQALQELAHVRIVEIVPQRRSVVAPIDDDLVGEGQFLRFQVESAVTAEACRLRTEADLAILEQIIARQQELLDKGLHRQLHEQDDAFHAVFYRIARKQEIYDLMRLLSIHFDRLRYMSTEMLTYPEIVEEHREILASVRERKEEQAERLVRAHLNRYRLDAIELRKRYPSYFRTPGGVPRREDC